MLAVRWLFAASLSLALAACSEGSGGSGTSPTAAGEKSTGSDSEADDDSESSDTPASASGAGTTPLSSLEETVAAVYVGRKISNRTQAYVFNRDRTGCYFWLHESGVRQDNVNFAEWSIDETKPTVDSNTSETLYPVVFVSERGNRSDADRFNGDTGAIWPSGQSGIRLSPSTTKLSCVKK